MQLLMAYRYEYENVEIIIPRSEACFKSVL